MIDKGEILEFAGILKLRPDVVEKDYVLGWLLAGISHHPSLGSSWVFKGGTCIKKCYFETYRFSEDLDFTITDRNHLNPEFLIQTFKEIAKWIFNQAGIEIPIDQIRFDLNRNSRGERHCEGRVYYQGSLQPSGSLPRVKLDLTADELLVCQPDTRIVTHPYSDSHDIGRKNIRCYAFEELFAEKIRALGDRTRPRDLYDVIYLYRNEIFRPAASIVLHIVRKKCDFKAVPIPSLGGLENYREELTGDWKNMLGHQLPMLPPLETIWPVLPEFFTWLENGDQPAIAKKMSIAPGQRVLHESLTIIGARPQSVDILEAIRFAASNRLCVDLIYNGNQRRIEPYSLRRTKDGKLLLHAIRTDGGEHRSYRVDRIQKVETTSQLFNPKYVVELMPTGPIRAPLTKRKIDAT